METKNMKQIYQQIAEDLMHVIPEEWNKIYLYAEYREGYKTIFFYYYPLDSDNPIYSLDIPDVYNVSEEEFDELHGKLYVDFTELWLEFKSENLEPWTHLTFILDHTGQMKMDFGYEELFGLDPVDKQDKWEEKYLV